MTKEQFERAKEIEKQYGAIHNKLKRIKNMPELIVKFYEPKDGENYGEWVHPFPEFKETMRKCIISDLESKLAALTKEMESL